MSFENFIKCASILPPSPPSAMPMMTIRSNLCACGGMPRSPSQRPLCKRQTSNVRRPTSIIKNPASYVNHHNPTSNIHHPVSNNQLPASNIKNQSNASSVHRQATRRQCPAPYIRHPTCDITRPMSKLRTTIKNLINRCKAYNTATPITTLTLLRLAPISHIAAKYTWTDV